MKQLLILSGKGGTGKTTVASAFIKLSSAKAYADCDVDAPNLHLAMNRTGTSVLHDYYGFPKAKIDPLICTKCGICSRYCRFNAIIQGERFDVDSFACEGCGVCEAVCPSGAVTMIPAVAGELALYIEDSVFSTAKLKMGNGTSGKLVFEVKKQLKSAASDVPLAIIDGSPGIGCPVIASLSGADIVLIVTEPSISGINDMERIIEAAEIFKPKIAVCVNKYDLNPKNTKNIEVLCESRGIPLAGRIPFDPEAVRAVNEGKTVIDTDCPSGKAIKAVYDKTVELLISDNQIDRLLC